MNWYYIKTAKAGWNAWDQGFQWKYKKNDLNMEIFETTEIFQGLSRFVIRIAIENKKLPFEYINVFPN